MYWEKKISKIDALFQFTLRFSVKYICFLELVLHQNKLNETKHYFFSIIHLDINFIECPRWKKNNSKILSSRKCMKLCLGTKWNQCLNTERNWNHNIHCQINNIQTIKWRKKQKENFKFQKNNWYSDLDFWFSL